MHSTILETHQEEANRLEMAVHLEEDIIRPTRQFSAWQTLRMLETMAGFDSHSEMVSQILPLLS